jgi:hypothetical protein
MIYRWIREAGLLTEEPLIKEIEFDELWHFIDSKNKTLAHPSR